MNKIIEVLDQIWDLLDFILILIAIIIIAAMICDGITYFIHQGQQGWSDNLCFLRIQ